MSDDSDDPLVGKVLNGRFKILEPLGVGGMGRVYKAMQSPLDRLIALKVLNPKYSGLKDPGFERRFFFEASMTAKLHHPNTITVHDYGRTDDGIFFIAMEYVEGDTLAHVLQKSGPIAWPRALSIAGQVARSLREAHKLGMIHRDLKPANVMVLREQTGSDMVKVLDFGLVKSFLPDSQPLPTETELTQAGVLLGSPLYMAPEQARGEADPRSDIYALGVLLFQIIAGKTPFSGKDSIDIIVKHIKERPPKLKGLVPELPDEVNELVMKCLEKEPADRYQSMDEVLDALKLAAANTGLSGAFSDPRSQVLSGGRTSSGDLSKRATPPPRKTGELKPMRSVEVQWDTGAIPSRNRTLIWVAGGVALAAVVTMVVVLTLGPSKPPPVVNQPPKVLVAPVKPPPRVDPVPPKIDPPPAPPEVTFQVTSTPPGAEVQLAGTRVGVTPFTLSLKPGADGQAHAQLTFSLDGYLAASASADGSGAALPVSVTLKKKTSGKKKPPPGTRNDPYKDDPYQ